MNYEPRLIGSVVVAEVRPLWNKLMRALNDRDRQREADYDRLDRDIEEAMAALKAAYGIESGLDALIRRNAHARDRHTMAVLTETPLL